MAIEDRDQCQWNKYIEMKRSRLESKAIREREGSILERAERMRMNYVEAFQRAQENEVFMRVSPSLLPSLVQDSGLCCPGPGGEEGGRKAGSVGAS